MKRWPIAACAIAAALLLPVESFAGKMTLPKDTEVKVRFSSAMRITSGALREGDIVSINLAEDIKVGGITIVEAGATGTASVMKAVSASKPGKPGKIALSFVDLSPKGPYLAQGGSTIKLRGEIEAEGRGKKVLAWLFIFGLFIKGSEAEINMALEYPAAVAETIILESP